VVWLVGVALASAPLTSPWSFYSQTAICIPLPITRTDFPGHPYSFAIIIVLNFVLFLFVSVGQVSGCHTPLFQGLDDDTIFIYGLNCLLRTKIGMSKNHTHALSNTHSHPVISLYLQMKKC
jgi:hypothetical protein